MANTNEAVPADVASQCTIKQAEKLKEPECPYVDADDNKLTLHIEWMDSHLLINPIYSNIDDVTRLHKHQMSREILALQAENYALEKQLYSYQQSLAKNNAKESSSRSTSRANSYDERPPHRM